MLNGSGFVKLANERVLLKHESRISCALSVPQEHRPHCTPFSRKSDRGTLFLTNKRVIYLPERPSQEPKFESFSAPILKLNDSTTSSSMFWGWMWKSDCVPVSGGGIPPDIPRIEVKLTFSDGGMMEFNETYIRLRERLFQWQEMQQEMGPGADIPDEPLPAYAGPSTQRSENEAIGDEAEVISAEDTLAQQRADSPANRPAPDEPPPNYEEAQAQQISIRLEDHIRDEADRGETRS